MIFFSILRMDSATFPDHENGTLAPLASAGDVRDEERSQEEGRKTTQYMAAVFGEYPYSYTGEETLT